MIEIFSSHFAGEISMPVDRETPTHRVVFAL